MDVPPSPRSMIDIGGAHGYFSVAMCRRHSGLHSTILELPEAVAHSAPGLAQEGMGDRISYREGDARVDGLGTDEEEYDIVFIANLAHHFNDRTNRDLVRRAARVLRPGGYCVILEIIRSEPSRKAEQIGALMDFYYAVTSASGTWSFDEMAEWQREAGMVVHKPIRLRMSPGVGMQAARKR